MLYGQTLKEARAKVLQVIAERIESRETRPEWVCVTL